MDNLLIIGAGGHGKVVAEAAELEKKYDKISFLDDRDDIKNIYNFKIVGKIDEHVNFANYYKYAFVAIGNNEKRLELISKLIDAGFSIPLIIHPTASVSKYSNIDIGTVILANAVVNVSTTIGKGCILNINSSVDHDCNICQGVHISSGVVIRSMVNIGELSIIDAGACVTAQKVLKDKSFVQAGKVF